MEYLLCNKEFNSCNPLLMSDESRANPDLRVLGLGSEMGPCSSSQNPNCISAGHRDVPDPFVKETLHVQLLPRSPGEDPGSQTQV